MGVKRRHLPGASLVAALCLLLCVSCGAKAEVRAQVGGVAELECGLPNAGPRPSGPVGVVEWVRQDLHIPVLIKFGAYPSRVHPAYEDRVSLVRTTTLRLQALALEDQGWYECRLLPLDTPPGRLDTPPTNGTWTLLSVTAPPVFTKTPPPVAEALVGSALSLVCVARGNPPPDITWTKDGGQLEGRAVDGGTLSLGVVSGEDGGGYTCRASNTEGNLTHTTTLRVKGPPVIVVPPKDTSLNMSQSALLRCQASADPPNMTYVWRRGGENVHHIESLKSRVKIMVDGTLLVSRLLPEDSGNYTCMPSNGLLTPPTASAELTVQHSAQALPMPRRTYLPTGLSGLLPCPVRAQPPLLRVDWTKDGRPLDLAKYPGWTLTSEGAVFMATVNDDVTGVYACTPYNSYGTMGQSEPTTVVLQDPPTLSVTPEQEYREQVGRALSVPCQTSGDQGASVTWSKVGPAPRSPYAVALDGSLLLESLSKDHQGAWQCTATNHVATVTARTLIQVLGTSPHAATSLSVSPGVTGANVSWDAGFDGGHPQTFTVWVKQMAGSAKASQRKPDWFSVPVPPSSGTRLRVSNLSPSTEYQFSVLVHNSVGPGPFSEICAARTLDPPPRRSELRPPSRLSANQSSAGVVLRWSPPADQFPPVAAFVVQSRPERGEWSQLGEDVDGNRSEIVVGGLRKDCVYELRLLSRRGGLLSEPSPSVNVSTVGMDVYPASSRLLEPAAEPLLAGVLGGVGVLCLGLLLLLGTSWFVGHKRERRRRRRKEDPPAAVVCESAVSPGSPDSVLKKKLLPPPHPPYRGSTSSSSSSSSSCPDHCPRQQLLLSTPPQQPPRYGPHDDRSLPRAYSAPAPPRGGGLELISRGADGRFVDPQPPSPGQTMALASLAAFGLRRSASLRSERRGGEEGRGRAPPFVLSVDLPPCGSAPLTHAATAVAERLSIPGRFYLDAERGLCEGEGPQDHRGSLCSDDSGGGGGGSGASVLVLQMEHERETGNLSRCLTLAREREALERELRTYTLGRKGGGGGGRGGGGERGRAGGEGEEGGTGAGGGGVEPPLWNPPQSGTGSCGVAERSSSSSSCVQWGVSPLTASPAGPPLGHPLDRSAVRHARLRPGGEVVSGGDFPRPSPPPDGDDLRPPRRKDNLVFAGFPPPPPPLSSRAAERDDLIAADSSPVFPEMSVDEPAVPASRYAPRPPPARPTMQRGGGARSATPQRRKAGAGGLGSPRGGGEGAWPQRSRSLDSRRGGGPGFLTPDAWIDSLSGEDCSSSSDPFSSFRPESPFFWGARSSPALAAAAPLPPPPPPALPSSDTPQDHRRGQVVAGSASRWPIGRHEAPRSAPGASGAPRAGGGASIGPPPAALRGGHSWPSAPPRPAPQTTEEERRRGDDGGEHSSSREAERETASSRGVPTETVGGRSYSSYASSGRGSMEPPGGRLSLCLSPALSPALPPSPHPLPEEEELPGDAEHGGRLEMEALNGRGRKASVDENYEWDSVDVSMHPGDTGLLLKSAPHCGLPSMPLSGALLKESVRPARRYHEHETEPVLF